MISMQGNPRMPRRKFISMLLLLWWLFGACLQAAQPELADVRVLIDVSGSMKQNDPQNLRRPALRLLVGLLPPETRAGVWTFGQYVNMLIPLGQVDPAWKAKARKSSESIGSPGQYTHIEDALKRSTEDWEGPSHGYKRSVILLTDGMIDISKDKTKNVASRRRVLETLLPQLKSRDVTIHTIALSKNADHELMRTLAESTGGWYEQAETAEQLQKVFLRIFEKVGKPDTVPLKDNKFSIDASITEATVLVFHKPDAQATEVLPPGGAAFDAEHTPSNVEWHRDQGYDMLTISDPKSGEWRIRAELDPDNRVMVVTDLKMQTSDLPNRLIQGQVLPFEVSFTDSGKLIQKREFLQVVEVSATQKDSQGVHEAIPLLDDGSNGDATAQDGLFSIRFGGESLNGGLSELVINATGRTFVREKRLTYEVVPPLVTQLTPDDSGEHLKLNLSADESLIDAGSLAVQAWLEDANGEQVELTLEKRAPGSFQTEIDLKSFAGSRKLALKATANSLAGESLTYLDAPVEVEGLMLAPVVPEPVPETAPAPAPAPAPEPVPIAAPEPATPPAVPEEPQEEASWLGSALWFIVINLLVLSAAGGAFWWVRRRNQRNLVSLVDAPADEETNEKKKKEKKPEEKREEKDE
jgi:uncharacterized protein (TIGR03503 family)